MKWIILIIVGFLALIVILNILGWIGGATQVVSEEFSPRVLFDRYLWFKDAAAQLDKKQADIAVYDARLKNLSGAYIGIPRGKWPREDREQYSTWSSEAAGIRASYNSLAAEYNAAMAKVNWKFAERGTLPPGATVPLPREFKPYISE